LRQSMTRRMDDAWADKWSLDNSEPAGDAGSCRVCPAVVQSTR
jgi:hypothetical protein